MTLVEFIGKLRDLLGPGDVLHNPGRGTSSIIAVTGKNLSYVRGHSPIAVGRANLYDAYAHFAGQRVTASDLKGFAPKIFDSNARPAGHSCNCTLLFMILKRMGLVDAIAGNGKKGDPFWVFIRANA